MELRASGCFASFSSPEGTVFHFVVLVVDADAEQNVDLRHNRAQLVPTSSIVRERTAL